MYPIEQWDVVMLGNNNIKTPMISIKPDSAFLELAKDNSYVLLCEISGTGTLYDGKKIPGVVDKSCFVPNCRPNFCKKTGWYVITLWANWYGYPNVGMNGTVTFPQIKPTLPVQLAPPVDTYKHEGPPPKKESSPGAKIEYSKEEYESSADGGMSTNLILLIILGIVLLAFISFLIWYMLRERNIVSN